MSHDDLHVCRSGHASQHECIGAVYLHGCPGDRRRAVASLHHSIRGRVNRGYLIIRVGEPKRLDGELPLHVPLVGRNQSQESRRVLTGRRH